MKPSKIFWGTFLITLGLLLLFINFETIPTIFDFVWYIWPLVFVFWGLSLLKVSLLIKQILAGLSGFIIALTIIGGISSGHKLVNYSENFWEDEFSKFDNFKIVSDSILCSKYNDSFSNMSLFIECGAGHYRIKDTTNSLIDLVSNDYNRNNFKCDSINKIIKLNLMNDYNFIEDGFNQEALIKLNNNPIWNISINVGAALFDCDLKNFKINKLNIQTGASKIRISIGDKLDSTQINLSSGLATFEIEVPKSSGCIIYSETGLTKKIFDDFYKVDKKTYKTSNFDTSLKKVVINISSGISSFKIKRY